MKPMDFQFYGERGIINGMLLDMYRDKSKVQERLNKFFSAIRLLDGSKPPWKEDIADCKWMMEPSLAQFGDPDFIARFKSGGTTYAVFFEGKLKDYTRSSLSISDEMTEKSYKGQSSKLNVQLALRYRFIRAYQASHTDKDLFMPIIERDHHYPDGRKRKLDKPTVLQSIRSFLNEVEEFYFIGLTNDLSLEESWTIDKAYWPPLEQHEIDKNINHFGLLTYSDLKRLKVIRDQNSHFSAARIMMNMNWPTIPSKKGDAAATTLINRSKIEDWNNELKSLAKDIFKSEPRLSFKEYAGSYSISVRGFTEMKLMKDPNPKKTNHLMLGLREAAGISRYHTQGIKPVEYVINGVNFYFFSFNRKQKEGIIDLALLYLDYIMSEESNLIR